MNMPLTTVRILDFTRLLPGPFCTAELADLGADVVKVEDAGAGDYLRQTPPIKNKFSFLYTLINRNKRSLSLDFQRGRAALIKLVETADVLVEGFRPGVMESRGLGYESLKTVNPKLVYCSITGYGQTGPWTMRAGHDLNYCALSGMSSQVGPTRVPNFQIADLVAGAKQAAIGILAALISARHDGQGRHVDVAMFDGCITGLIAAYAAKLANGHAPEPGADLLSGAMPFYDLYPTRDGRYVAFAAIEDKFWKAFCLAVEKPDWLGRHFDLDIRKELAELFASQTLAYWTALANRHECCLEPVLTLDEALELEHTRQRAIFVESPHPSEGLMRIPLTPLKMTDFSAHVRRPAPERGQHNHEILRALGFDDDAIAEMTRR